jgi:protein TonB
MTSGPAPRIAPFARGRSLPFLGISACLHAALLAAVLLAPPRVERRTTPVSIDIVETRPPAPEPEPPRPEPPPPVRPARRIAKVQRPRLPEDAPPPPRREAPPPPNAPPPARRESAPIRIGISMSSTTTASDYAAPTGNTLYGSAPETAGDPASGGPPAVERYAPPSQVTSLPEPLGCDIPKSEYPEEARRLGIEGEVKLRLVIDREGAVKDVKVLRDPGHGFGSVAQRCARSYCRFRPALKNGEAVATQIPYTIRFEL